MSVRFFETRCRQCSYSYKTTTQNTSFFLSEASVTKAKSIRRLSLAFWLNFWRSRFVPVINNNNDNNNAVAVLGTFTHTTPEDDM